MEFDKFQEGDIITFKEGIPREVSCTAFQSLPVAHVEFKVGDKTHGGVKTKSQVQKLASLIGDSFIWWSTLASQESP